MVGSKEVVIMTSLHACFNFGSRRRGYLNYRNYFGCVAWVSIDRIYADCVDENAWLVRVNTMDIVSYRSECRYLKSDAGCDKNGNKAVPHALTCCDIIEIHFVKDGIETVRLLLTWTVAYSSCFVCPRIFNSVCCIHALVCGPTSKRPASDGGLCSGQLLMMWSAVCSGSPHSHAALSPVPTYSHMICSNRSQCVNCSESPSVLHTYLPLDAFSSVQYVALYSGGSGCFPLLLPRCRSSFIIRTILRDDT